MAAERLAAEVEGHFKTQVQEWKNVLLRGSDNALREQHWKGFLADERAVQDKTAALLALVDDASLREIDRKSTRLNSSHLVISYAVFCLKKKNNSLRIPGLRDICVTSTRQYSSTQRSRASSWNLPLNVSDRTRYLGRTSPPVLGAISYPI